MATTVTIQSNYAGKAAGRIMGQCFNDMTSLKMGLFTVAENVNYKYNLRMLKYTDGTTDYACGFTPAGALDLSEKVIIPEKYKNDLEICKEDFRQTWDEDLFGPSAHNRNMPKTLLEAVQVEVLGAIATELDRVIWQGKAATTGEFSGLLEQFTADADVIDVTLAAITEANVEVELKKALEKIPACLIGKDLIIALAPNVYQAYYFFLIGKGISAAGACGTDKCLNTLKFGHYTLKEVTGLPTDNIVIYEKRNIVFVTGLLGDHNQIKFIDGDTCCDLSGNIKGKVVYNAGIGYYFGDQIVWGKPTTP